jgi:hypothetical protein
VQERNRFLEMELAAAGGALQQARWRIETLEQELQAEKANSAKATAQLAELTENLRNAP